MKKTVVFLMVAIVLLVFPSCSLEAPQTPKAAEESAKFGNPSNYTFQLEDVYHSPSKENYLYVPPACYKDFVLLTFDPYTNVNNESNTAVLDLRDNRLSHLPFKTEEFRMDDQSYYWFSYDRVLMREVICRTDRKTLETDVIYSPVANRIMNNYRLSYGDRYLAWSEFTLDGKGNIDQYYIMVYDIVKNEAFLVDEVKFLFGFAPLLVINQGFLAYSDMDQDGYIINGYDLTSRKKVMVEKCDLMPKGFAFDGVYLVWIDGDGKRTLTLSSPGTSFERKLGDNCDVADVFQGEYIIYSQDMKLYVYSISKEKIIYESQDDMRDPTVSWFIVDHQTGRVALKCEHKDDTNGAMVLNMQKAD